MVYFKWYLLDPHVQAVQNMHALNRLQATKSWSLNQSEAVGGTIRGPFPVSLPIFGPLEGSEALREAHSEPLCQRGQFFWSKMACTGVPQIVLHVLCSTRTSGGYFRPSEVSFRGISALLGDYLYIYIKFVKCDIFSRP